MFRRRFHFADDSSGGGRATFLATVPVTHNYSAGKASVRQPPPAGRLHGPDVQPFRMALLSPHCRYRPPVPRHKRRAARPGWLNTLFQQYPAVARWRTTGAKCNRIVVIVVAAVADLDSGARKRVRARYEVIARKPTRPPDLGRCALGRGAMKQAIAPAHAAIAFLSR